MKHSIETYISVLSVALLLSGCSHEPDKVSETPTNFELLQGDWVTEKYSHGFGLKHFHINVEDSIFTMFSGYSDSVNFNLNKNQIVVYDSTDTYYFGNHQKYKIEKLDNQELILITQSNKVKKRLNDFSWTSDTLTFHKLVKKNNLDPLTIGFSSLGCFGSCPSMKLQINNDLSIKFFGGIYSDYEGGYSGRIDRKIYNSIIKQIQYLPLDSLKSEYIAPWTDDQTKYLIIQTKDTTRKIKAYGVYDQPVELTILMNNLMDLYKRLQIVQNNSVNDSTSFNEYLKISHPIVIPPPPLIE